MRCDDEGARYSSTAADAAIRRPLRTNGSQPGPPLASQIRPPRPHAGSDAPFRLSRAGHDGVSGPDDAYARHLGAAWPGYYRQSLFGVFERRQHCKPLLRPARQHDLVVGVEPEAVIPHDHQVGAQSEETTDR